MFEQVVLMTGITTTMVILLIFFATLPVDLNLTLLFFGAFHFILSLFGPPQESEETE